METIERNHCFENRLNLVVKKRKYFYLYHEKDERPSCRVEITPEGLLAFNREDWHYFIAAEAADRGGVPPYTE